MSEIVGILESVGPTIIVEVMDAGPEGLQGIQGEKGDGWTDAYYTPGTGKITFESDDGLGFVTDDLRGAKGDVGDMWKPSIDGAGNISWTQSSSTTAPTPTNIRGPIGVTGAKPSHAWDGTKLQFENPDGSMGNKVDLKGLKGDTGDVWKPTVNASGVISWTKDSSATAPTERNITGPQGLKGDKPAHSWAGTLLTFENPDGTPGTPVNLQGPQGDIGPAPIINYPTLAGEIDYDELSGYVDLSNYIHVVKHGTNGNTARPVGASVVYWVGTVEPTKALNDDMWLGEE